jgi:hypothetical protein
VFVAKRARLAATREQSAVAKAIASSVTRCVTKATMREMRAFRADEGRDLDRR